MGIRTHVNKYPRTTHTRTHTYPMLDVCVCVRAYVCMCVCIHCEYATHNLTQGTEECNIRDGKKTGAPQRE